jgi:hypothetical protein
MNVVELQRIEAEVKDAIGAILSKYASALKEARITADAPGIERTIGASGYDSEVSVLVFRDGEPIDALVYMICLAGKTQVGPEAICKAFEQDIRTLLS